jgi:hypothetical protein
MYEYFDVLMKLCTSFDDCILVSKMHRTWGCGHDLYLGKVVVKNLYWGLV